MNTSWLALDYHCEQGRGDNTALIYDSPVTGNKRLTLTESYAIKLRKLPVCFLPKALKKGDRVVVYMPMIPEAAMAMLALHVWVRFTQLCLVVLRPNELAVRIEDAEPKVIMTASCGIEISKIIPYKPLVDKAIMDSRWKPEKVFVSSVQNVKPS